MAVIKERAPQPHPHSHEVAPPELLPPHGEVFQATDTAISGDLQYKKTRLMREAEKKVGVPIEDYLLEHYYQSGESTIAIGRVFGVSDTTVGRWLRRFDIPMHSYRESTRLFYQDPIKKEAMRVRVHTKAANEKLGEASRRAWLLKVKEVFGENPQATLRQMVASGKTVDDIAQAAGWEPYRVRFWLNRFGIEVPRRKRDRSAKESNLRRRKGDRGVFRRRPNFSMIRVERKVLEGLRRVKQRFEQEKPKHPRKTKKMCEVEARFNLPIETLHQKLYWDEKMSLTDEARLFGISPGAMSEWSRRLRLPTRSANEAVELSWHNAQTRERRMSGANAAWQDSKKKKERVDRIHSPEADKQRRESLSESWNKDPEKKEERIKALHEAYSRARARKKES